MKKIVASLVTSLALIGAAPVYAQAPAADPAAMAAAKELFESMNYRSVMIGAMQQMSQSIGASMHAGAEASIKNNPKLSADDKQKALAQMEAELPGAINTMQAVMSDPALVDEIMAETVPLYARNFSAAELKQITAFYRTPVGAKMLSSMPKLMGEGMQLGQLIVQRRLGPLMQKMQQQQAK
ncbi:hypothetical protein SAMN05192549_109130 [Duganella sacchari]|uniref:DUF2059 domain-containing protein n=1 Tax=Duganella sacchari TaxID=551987 RepID=A0A1M7R1H5_9BURK|nr:DUF2059 domain-containing protein [Duganella sacchari]SHN38462.1 hypothetical protein SAMN05192549_109130 [Duganella sacchari]